MYKTSFVFAFVLMFCGLARGDSNFVRVPVGQGASIELPKNWVVMSGGSRITLDAAVEATRMKTTTSKLGFAANLFDDGGRSIALVNVRFYPDNTLTQEDAKGLTKSDIESVEQEMRKGIEPSLQATGARVTRWYPAKVQQINETYVFIHEHQQAGPGDAAPSRYRSVRVWASPRSFTVTFSFQESNSQLLLPIIERATNSLRRGDIEAQK